MKILAYCMQTQGPTFLCIVRGPIKMVVGEYYTAILVVVNFNRLIINRLN